MVHAKIVMLLVWSTTSLGFQKETVQMFPSTFQFGVATSAYQIEGAWNTSGKGENIWDRLIHQHPEAILDASNGDIACDSYHKVKEDVALLKHLGVNFYRFSLSWSRILPNGFKNEINSDGIRYYNELINELLNNNIQPMVTLYHWDTPQSISDLGSFTNSLTIGYYKEYANIAFTHFGNRVKYWLTFNEPKQVCLKGYNSIGGELWSSATGVAEYICAHNIVKAHAIVYHLYKNVFKQSQHGRVSIALDGLWFEPGSNSTEDREAAERALHFELGVYANPIFHEHGDYPEVVKTRVYARSRSEGFTESRLPKFTLTEIQYIKGTFDFFGLNHYITKMTSDAGVVPINSASYYKDLNVITWDDPSWPLNSSTLKIVPWGFRKLLNWIKTTYNSPEIIVTENGYTDKATLDDQGRINYLKLYMSAMLTAIEEDHVNVVAYTAWSLMNNFEWFSGYTEKFGLYHVDFSDPNLPRTAKNSARFYKDVIANRRLVLKNKF